MRCANCGKEINPLNIACKFCGTAIDDSGNNEPNVRQNNTSGNTNVVNTNDNSQLVGLIFIIAGIVMSIIIILFLTKISNSRITYRYNSTTSSVAIIFFMHIIIQSILLILLGFRVDANGLTPFKAQTFGNTIILIGGSLFLMASVSLGITLQVIGFIVFVIGCYAN